MEIYEVMAIFSVNSFGAKVNLFVGAVEVPGVRVVLVLEDVQVGVILQVS